MGAINSSIVSTLEHAALWFALLSLLAGLALNRSRPTFTRLSCMALTGACVSLAWHLLGDHFVYRYVWLYSAEQLPLYLKLANLWGGEEGVLLVLATMLSVLSVRLLRHQGWAGPGCMLLTIAFTGAALVWNPFTATTDEQLARSVSRGMNVHLMSKWMALHPPFMFIAYVLILAPAGAAAEALRNGGGALVRLSEHYAQLGWLMLSIGLGFGMWWAFQDFSFGQIWHWDPVQTSVFAVWALLTAQLHALRRYRSDGAFVRTVPVLSLMSAAAVLTSMAVTRSSLLASSHRYIGETSAPLLCSLAVLVLVVAVVAWCMPVQRRSTTIARTELGVLIGSAVFVFALVAVIAEGALAYALVNAYMETPRPDWSKPFLETLVRWGSPHELEAIRRAFATWDIDGFALNRWLAPATAVLMFLAGHAFLRTRRRALGWMITLTVIILAVVVAAYLNPMARVFRGTGVTSQQTVQIFFWLEMVGIGSAYVFACALLWILRILLGPSARKTYQLSVGLIHSGAALALLSIGVAMVFDSYTQEILGPDGFGQIHRVADGYRVRVEFDRLTTLADGGRQARSVPFQAVANVSLQIGHAEDALTSYGETVFRDGRDLAGIDGGPVRQLCEILDHRYARYVSGPSYMLHPFIRHGLASTEQVWVSPSFEQSDGQSATLAAATVVIRTYPLLTGLWVGLIMVGVGSLFITVARLRG